MASVSFLALVILLSMSVPVRIRLFLVVCLLGFLKRPCPLQLLTWSGGKLTVGLRELLRIELTDASIIVGRLIAA